MLVMQGIIIIVDANHSADISEGQQGTQFRTRTKGIKSPIPAEVIREIDTVVIRSGMINRSDFADLI
jgi:hypothetical protein